jgi:hypothetical protein
VAEADSFARWLHELAIRPPGSDGSSLSFAGRYLRVAIVFVAAPGRLAAEGLKPYRRRVKRLIYDQKFDVVYLIARDRNMAAVDQVADELEGDGLIVRVARYRYRLRADFKKRVMHRERAICVCLRRRRVGEVQAAPAGATIEDDSDLPQETFEVEPEEPAAVGSESADE